MPLTRALGLTSILWMLSVTTLQPLSAAGVKLHLYQDRPVVEGVFVNGHGPFRFLVDTATTSNLLAAEIARSIGLTPTFQAELISSVATMEVSGSDGVEVALGDVRASRQRFLFTGIEAVRSLSKDIHGVLGQEFLSRFDYMLDLRARRLEFGSQSLAGSRATFRLLGGRAVFATSLGTLVLDSGASNVVLFGTLPDRSEQSEITTMTGSQTVGRLDSKLVIDGRPIWSGRAVALPKNNEPGVSGLLPTRLFRAVYMSNSEGYAIFR